MSDIVQRLLGSLDRGFGLHDGLLKEAAGEIDRLRARIADLEQADSYKLYAENKRLRAERDKLVAALRSADCPAGGFNGMPKYAAATVETCLKYNVCGCWFGAAISTVEGKK